MLTFSSSWIKFYFWHWSGQGESIKKSETFLLFLWFLTFFLRFFYFYHDFFICFSLMWLCVNFRDFFFSTFFQRCSIFLWVIYYPRMLWERGGEQIFVINAWSILYCVIDIIQFVEINVRRWAHSKLLEAIVTVENYTNIVLYKKKSYWKGKNFRYLCRTPLKFSVFKNNCHMIGQITN